MSKNGQTIIIRRSKSSHHDDEHGGAWKVAYADFMTAMMAFFLLLWLLSLTEDEKLQGVADYFTPTEISLTSYGSEDVLSGETLPEEQNDLSDQAERATTDPTKDENEISQVETVEGATNPWAKLASSEEEQDAGSAMILAMKESLERLIAKDGPLADLAENLVIREQNGRLLIEILDVGDSPLFQRGSAELTESNVRILRELALQLQGVPQKLTITGHTDASPYNSDGAYTNWELSSDRANATRRVINAYGVSSQRIESISGVAAQDPFYPEDPYSGRNRRVTIALISDTSGY